MLRHSGSVSRDSEEERAFMALSISITTRMERETVEAVREAALVNMAQPISGKAVVQRWKWVCGWNVS